MLEDSGERQLCWFGYVDSNFNPEKTQDSIDLTRYGMSSILFVKYCETDTMALYCCSWAFFNHYELNPAQLHYSKIGFHDRRVYFQ